MLLNDVGELNRKKEYVKTMTTCKQYSEPTCWCLFPEIKNVSKLCIWKKWNCVLYFWLKNIRNTQLNLQYHIGYMHAILPHKMQCYGSYLRSIIENLTFLALKWRPFWILNLELKSWRKKCYQWNCWSVDPTTVIQIKKSILSKKKHRLYIRSYTSIRNIWI